MSIYSPRFQYNHYESNLCNILINADQTTMVFLVQGISHIIACRIFVLELITPSSKIVIRSNDTKYMHI